MKKITQGDLAFAVFSVLFVVLYFVFHLKSCFLALVGILLILFSFSLAGFIYQAIFRITFMSNLHYLIVFIVLGIAADNIFVFVDAWRQSECINIYRGDKKQRMSYTWRRAVRAISVTSATTTVAFLANIFSSQMPVKAFGIFAAIIIPSNLLLVITLFPPAIIIFEKYLVRYKVCCFCPRGDKNVSTIAPDGNDESASASKD